MCINIGDQFARAVYYGRYKVIPIRTEIIKFCESIGFDYMGAIIWQKQTTTNTTGEMCIRDRPEVFCQHTAQEKNFQTERVQVPM